MTGCLEEQQQWSMSAGVLRGVDLLAASAALLAVAMTWVYVRVMHDQGDRPLVWVQVILIGSAVLATYGASLAAVRRRAALVAAGVGLVVLGFLAILSIGLPILVAGALALASSARSAPPRVDVPPP
jgi:hypothetical protein